jgi:DNA anti-recombination protein RmuC
MRDENVLRMYNIWTEGMSPLDQARAEGRAEAQKELEEVRGKTEEFKRKAEEAQKELEEAQVKLEEVKRKFEIVQKLKTAARNLIAIGLPAEQISEIVELPLEKIRELEIEAGENGT